MKAHVLLRGQYLVDKDTKYGRSSYERNFLDIRDNFQQSVMDDLASAGYDTKLWIITYHDKYDDEILSLGAEKTIFIDGENLGQPGFHQMEVVSKGVDLITKNDDAWVFILRFDIIYKRPITTWFYPRADIDLILPWREMNDEYQNWHYVQWKAKYTHTRVGDSFFILRNDRDNLRRFQKSINYDPYCAHEKYEDFISRNLRVGFCVDGYYNSDTACGTNLADNPLFMLQRPLKTS